MSRRKSKTPKRSAVHSELKKSSKPLSAPLFINRGTPLNSQSSFVGSQMSQDNSQLVKPGQSLFSDNEEDDRATFDLDSQRPSRPVPETVSKKRKRSSNVEPKKQKKQGLVPKARRNPLPVVTSKKTRKVVSQNDLNSKQKSKSKSKSITNPKTKPKPIQVEELEIEDPDSEPEDSFFEQVDIPSNESNENILQTFKKSITTNSMQRNWALLPPIIVTMLDSIFQLFIENSILNIKFRSNREKQLFRTFIKSELIKPIIKRFKKIKLPQGIKESELDKEELTEENSRLESNLDANLKQLNVLNLESKTQELYLKKEKTYLHDFEKSLNSNLRKMKSDLKELEHLIGDDDEMLKEFENSLEQDERDVLTYDLVNDNTENTKQVYDPASDEELQDVLDTLSKHLQSVEKNIDIVKPVSEKLEALSSLLSLLLD